jgi:hypothetical protein
LVQSYGLNGRRVQVLLPAGARIFSSPCIAFRLLGPHPASYPTGGGDVDSIHLVEEWDRWLFIVETVIKIRVS